MNQYLDVRKYIFAFTGFLMLTLVSWSVRELLTLANFTMLYILFVLLVAIRLGTYPAMTAAFVGFLSINFFLTKPYYTFLVADSRDVIDLIIFIIVAVLCGQLGAYARLQAEVAHQRAKEQEILYKLTGMMNQATDAHQVHQALHRTLLEDLEAQQAYILPYEIAPSDIAGNTVHFLPLKATDHIYGTVCVAFSNELTFRQRQLLITCVTQVAMALQRIELTERARAGKQYEEADRLKTAILRAVSHDLRTPLTVIKTSADNLQRFGNSLSPKERLEIAEVIENEADQLNNLVGNLLDLSRLQAGALTLNKELNSLEEVAGDVVARVWQLTGKERVQIQFPSDLPLVYFDYGLILQAMSNLVDNALRYEPDESLIQIIGCVLDDHVQVHIINHGTTISAEDREHIMEPFIHGKDGGHVGLGLPIAKGIVEAHQGQLLIEDTPGGGATFILVLPLTIKEQTPYEIENTRR